MKASVLVVAVSAAVSTPLIAQTQQVKPPIAVYWISVETAGGMGMAMPPGMAGMMPPGMQGGKRLRLDLGSTQAANGEPRGQHAIPGGLNMGPSLPLVTPRSERAAPGRPDEQPEQRAERPRGRMLIYWGCGENVRAGQPVIVDFSRLDAEGAARAFRSRNVSRPAGPAPGRSRTYGEWPNAENTQAVPANASLRGDHVVSANYSPEMRFTIGERHDFMDPVAFDAIRKTAAGAYQVKWTAIPTATGYFAMATGRGESDNDVVMWSSSDVQDMGYALMDYLPPAEVQRLVREKVVLAPQTTECAVPAVFKGEGAMLNFIAYGDELNVVHPPRPSDPKKTWEQEWAAKVRLKSTGMTMLASDGMSGRQRTPSPATADQGEPAAAEERATGQPRTPDVLQEGIKTLRGIFGR